MKLTKIEEKNVIFHNDSTNGGMNSFWIMENSDNKFMLGVNGRYSSVTGRHDQTFGIEEAKDIVKFLSERISKYESGDKSI